MKMKDMAGERQIVQVRHCTHVVLFNAPVVSAGKTPREGSETLSPSLGRNRPSPDSRKKCRYHRWLAQEWPLYHPPDPSSQCQICSSDLQMKHTLSLDTRHLKGGFQRFPETHVQS